MDPSLRSSLTAAQAHYQAGRFHQAEVLCRQVLTAEPGCAEAWGLLGQLAQRADRPADAVALLRRAAQLAPADAAAQTRLGLALGAAGQRDEALGYFRRAVALAPETAEAHHNLGACLRLLGRLDEAADCFRAALRLKPDLAAARTALDAVLQPRDVTPPAAAAPRPAGRATVSLCLIVKNEEHHLPACLASVAGLVDEVVVVDTGSTDATVEIATRHSARVVSFPWADSFAAARNAGLEQATGRWIFWLDADDRLDADNRRKLQTVFDRLGDENAAYVMQCRCLPHDPAESATVVDHVRLFRNDPRVRWEYRVHEQILPAVRRIGGEVRRTDVVIEHAGYQDEALRLRKQERNLRLLRLDEQERPDDPFLLFNLGLACQQLDRPADAVPSLRRGLDRAPAGEPTRRPLFALLARCTRTLGRPAEALAACRAGLREFPDDTELLYEGCLAARDAGDNAEAEACLLRLVEGREQDYFVSVSEGLRGYLSRHKLGVLYLEQGRLAEAEAQWRRALAERPDYALSWQGLGLLCLRQGRWPELAEAARALAGLRDVAAARRLLEDGLARAPQAQPLREALDRLAAG